MFSSVAGCVLLCLKTLWVVVGIVLPVAFNINSQQQNVFTCAMQWGLALSGWSIPFTSHHPDWGCQICHDVFFFDMKQSSVSKICRETEVKVTASNWRCSLGCMFGLKNSTNHDSISVAPSLNFIQTPCLGVNRVSIQTVPCEFQAHAWLFDIGCYLYAPLKL